MTALAKWFLIPVAVPVSAVAFAGIGWLRSGWFVTGYAAVCFPLLFLWQHSAGRLVRSDLDFMRENVDQHVKRVLAKWSFVTIGVSFAIQAVALFCLIVLSMAHSPTGSLLAAGAIFWAAIVWVGTLSILAHHVLLHPPRDKNVPKCSPHGSPPA
jgi:hypothetical protein